MAKSVGMICFVAAALFSGCCSAQTIVGPSGKPLKPAHRGNASQPPPPMEPSAPPVNASPLERFQFWADVAKRRPLGQFERLDQERAARAVQWMPPIVPSNPAAWDAWLERTPESLNVEDQRSLEQKAADEERWGRWNRKGR